MAYYNGRLWWGLLCVVLAAPACAIDERELREDESGDAAADARVDASERRAQDAQGERDAARVEVDAWPEVRTIGDAPLIDVDPPEAAPVDARSADARPQDARSLDGDTSTAVRDARPDAPIVSEASPPDARPVDGTAPESSVIDAAPEASPLPCGGPCPGPVRGVGQGLCNGNACTIQCGAGLTLCGGNSCVDTTTDPAHCAACGHACPAPAAGNGTATCVASMCGISCPNARLSCGGACCPAPVPNQVATCITDRCGIACVRPHTQLTCLGLPAGTIACGNWTFESNTSEGWTADLTPTGNAAEGPTYAAAAPGPGSGTRSLAINVEYTSSRQEASITGNVCPNAMPANRDFLGFHARVWFQPAADSAAPLSGTGYLRASDGADSAGEATFTSLQAGTWLDWSLELTSFSVTDVTMSVILAPGWRGTIFFDDLSLEPLF